MKKIGLMIAGLMAMSVVHAQEAKDSFHIKGHLANAAHLKLTLVSFDPASKLSDSTETDANGNFEFKGQVKRPYLYFIMSKKDMHFRGLFLENARYTAKGDANDMKGVKITGPKDQAVYTEWCAIEEPREAQFDVEEKKLFRPEMDSLAKAKVYDSAQRALVLDQGQIIKKVVIKHPSSATSVYLTSLLFRMKQVELADTLIRVLEKNAVASEDVKKLRINADRLLRLQTGKEAPDFSVPDAEGKVTELSSLKGGYVLVDFWASWCKPCRAENPNLVKAYEAYKAKGFKIVSISLDTDRDKWLEAVKTDQLPWMQLSDLKGATSKVASAYAITSIPANFLLDPSGRIVEKSLRGHALEEKLASIYSAN